MDYAEDFTHFGFTSPFLCAVVGSTNTGKTTLVKKIIQDWPRLTSGDLPVWQLILIFEHDQPLYHQIIESAKKNFGSKELVVRCIKGWREETIADQNLFRAPAASGDCQTILIVDDCLHKLNKSEALLGLCRGRSHHEKVSLFLIAQDITATGPELRGALKNIHYFIITQGTSDLLRLLQSKLYPYNRAFLQTAFNLNKQYLGPNKYPYLVLNNTPACPKNRSVYSGLFMGGEEGYLFAPSD